MEVEGWAAAVLTRLNQMLRRAAASTARRVLCGSDWTWTGASAALPTGQSSLLGQPLRKYMVRAEPPPTPRRPAAPSPVRPSVRPTQRPGAGRPPPAPPPPAARGICPRAGPGHRDANLRRHLRADGAQCGGEGGGRVGDSDGAEERGDPPRPRPVLGPRGRQHPAPRGKAAARARAREASRSPASAPGNPAPAPEATPPSSRAASARRGVQTPAGWPPFRPPSPPSPGTSHSQAGARGQGRGRLGGGSG